MEEIKFRNLTKEEIEVRVGSNKTLLLYKTARVDANILDETVGPFNWQKRFYQVKNTMICEISINANYEHPEKEPVWIAKADGGDDDYMMEKVKAECSDSMKRAAFQWSIGRSLYTAPKIKIPEEYKDCQFFDVEEIGYDENNRIKDLVISTNFGKDIVFSYKNGRKVAQNAQKPQNTSVRLKDINVGDTFVVGNTAKSSITKAQKDTLNSYAEGLTPSLHDKFFLKLDELFGVGNIELLSEQQANQLIDKIHNK